MDDYWNNILVGNMEANDSQQFFELRREAKILLDSQKGRNVASKAEAATAAAAASTRAAAANKENEPGQQRNNQTMGSAELMRLVEERLGACSVATTKSAAAAQSLAIPPAAAAAAASSSSSRSTTATSSLANSPFRSTDTSPRPAAAVFKKPAATTAAAAASRAILRKPNAATASSVPNAYRYKAIYDQKLKRKAARQAEEERKAREVVARPMPNFALAHRLLAAKRQEVQPQAETCPNTPETLRKSRQAAERLKLRQEEYVRQLSAVPAYKARPAEVLQQAPYKPRLEHREIYSAPFQLPGDAVGEELRESRERRERDREQRRAAEAAEAERRERREKRELRKNTEFKARPNPFV